MAENLMVEYSTEKGRRVETHTYEHLANGQKERITETHVELVPMALSQRVIEKIVPIVASRTKEMYKDGKVVNSVTEELDHGTTKLALRHGGITKEELVEVLRGASTPGITKEELVEALQEVMKSPVKLKAAPPVVEETPSPSGSKLMEFAEMGLYVILSGELAFCLYHLLLKNWL